MWDYKNMSSRDMYNQRNDEHRPDKLQGLWKSDPNIQSYDTLTRAETKEENG